ncbi:MAG: FAD-dependent monooxygenase [Xanthobacteraceae bacterium]
MRDADIIIIGGGLAGSIATAMLGRAGFHVALIDPHPVYPPDFRCEKLDARHIRVLHKTGLAVPLMSAMTHDRYVWIARSGRLLERGKPSQQYGIRYEDLVNAVRAQVPNNVEFVIAKATAVRTGTERQMVASFDGQELGSRLVILANGLNIGLRRELGMTRKVVSESHSISIGFDMVPVGRHSFDFPALNYNVELPSDRTALLTLFPIGSVMRANLFVYRDMRDPWLREMRQSPCETLLNLMPRLTRLTGDFEVSGTVKIRRIDLYVTRGHRQAGVVVVGDAFATSCPAAGTGALKVFTDVERLCNIHVPRWLATPGMDKEKIASFYDDSVKQACDVYCANKAFSLRSQSIDPGFAWRLRRGAKFIAGWGTGAVRAAIEQVAPANRRTSAAAVKTQARSNTDSPPLIPQEAAIQDADLGQRTEKAQTA